MDNSFSSDFVTALARIENPAMNGKANYGKYARIEDCLDASKKILSDHNLAIVQLYHADPDRLVTRIVHKSGEYIEDGGVPLYCVDKNNPQKLIGAGTYARRAGLCALLGLVGVEDDDGQSATPTAELPKPKKPVAQPPQESTAVTRYDSSMTVPDIADTFDIPPEKNGPAAAAQVYANTASTIEEKWVNDAVAGFARHRHMGDHNKWAADNRDTRASIKRTNPALHQQLLGAWQSRKNQLEGKTDV